MDWKDIGKAVGKFAPMLGGAIGGPVAGGAISLLTNALGLGGDASPDAVMDAINADPNAVLKLKTVQEENKVSLAEIALKRDALDYDDTKDARARQVAVETATGKKDINLYVIAYMFIGGFFVSTITMLCLVLGGEIPTDIPQFAVFLVGSLFGTLTSGVTAIVQYFFGSSKSSSEKTKMLLK